MSIQKIIKIKHNKLPTKPGVYLMRDKKGKVVYVGKATNLKIRVNSYFSSQSSVHSSQYRRTIDEMLHEVARIDYQVTDSVIEALILEANLIKKYQPRYNVREKDDKSFLYVVITNERFPKVQLVRGNELAQYATIHNPPQPSLTLREGDRSFFPLRVRGSARGLRAIKVFGPYTSASSIRAALDLMRKWFPWRCMTRITTNKKNESPRKPCFDYHIGRCPGVCVGAVTRKEYMKNIRNVILMLEGKKAKVMKNLELRMKNAAREEKFEEAESLKRKLFALKHIRDVAVLAADGIEHRAKRQSSTPYALCPTPISILGRIEGYDISNISGTSAVGSMVVFQNGEPSKREYKRFKIKTVQGINDVAMMREVLARRFKRSGPPLNLPLGKGEKEGVEWPMPDLIVIDGGWGQVNAARDVVQAGGLHILIVGIAKGFKRKQDRPIFDKDNPELVRIVENYKDFLLRVRDEAHRFAVCYHRRLRGRGFRPRRRKKFH
ncbi:GIY-YIG nuclease family protein [Candidatus Uhrbacteria bacterium]|nr:GIY-YIG nuclease family protein [Candidatus Uhrbacteria bacterium]